MTKLAVKRSLVFIGILAGLTIGCLFTYLGYPAIAQPWKLHLVMVDADASAEAWVDTNGNGYRDPNEPSMGGVCVWDELTLQVPNDEEMAQICDSPSNQTGESGEWPSPEERYLTFRAGASCEDIYIFARPPQGFQATTPIVVNDCHAEFGFAPEGSVPQDFSYDDYIQSKK